MNFLKFALPVLFMATACNTDPDAAMSSNIGLYIYPNPTTYAIDISTNLGSETSLEVIDSNGEAFFKQTVGTQGHVYVELADRPSGVYHVIAKTKDKALTSEFIKL